MEAFLQTNAVGLVAGGLLVLVLFAILDYSGLFVNVKVRRVPNPVGALRVAYLYNTGPYKNCGPLFERVQKLAGHQRCMGIYYDDPNTTPASELRYIVASILAEGDEPADEEVSRRLAADGFQAADFPAIKDALTAQFPFPWMLSIFFAVWKVYPKLARSMKELNVVAGPAIEVYSETTINFYMPIGNMESYLVPEAHASGQKLKSS